MPKVSIIVPTYNVEQYLEECMDSIVNQTLKDIEIICINDGSTDNSGKILDEYASKDNRIKVIHKENGGYGKAMNIGLDNVTGEYIGIVEPDDYIDLTMYETLYNKVVKTDIDIIKADYCRFIGDKNDRRIIHQEKINNTDYYNKIINLKKDITPFSFPMNTWNGIYKRDFIEKYHIRHNETPGASFQDNGFWFQTYALANTIYYLDSIFYYNRRDNINSSVKNPNKVYCIVEEYKFIRNFIDKYNFYDRLINFYTYKKFVNYLWNFYRIDIKFKKEFLNLFAKELKIANKNKELIFDWCNSKELLAFSLILKNKRQFYYKSLNKLTFFQKIFSIKNKQSSNNKWHKVIYILGIKFSFRNKIKEKRVAIEQEKQFIKDSLTTLTQQNNELKRQNDDLKNEIKDEIKKIYNQVHIKNNNQKLSFRTVAQLTELIRNKINIIPEDIDLVVGIPRSGVIPAYLIALFLNKRACTVNEFINNIEPTNGRTRPIQENNINNKKKKILIVDDSIYSGKSMDDIKKLIQDNLDCQKYEFHYCAIFAKEESKNLVDHYFEIVEAPRMFQWNYLNHTNAQCSCFDMDGVLCVDPTDEQNDDGEKYIDFILNASPLYIPNFKINSIVTSRLEKYRPQTEQWLKEHNVMYDNLYMLDGITAEERRKSGCHANFKAKIFAEKENCIYFIESNREQAKKIAELTGKQTICIETDEYFNG